MQSLVAWWSGLGEDSIRRVGPWVLLALTLLLLLPGNNLLPLIDRDEPRFAQATREMMARDEWVVPYFNEEYRFDKPVLVYWLMRLSYLGLGANEFSARLPAVLCTALLVWLVFRMGSRWFTPSAGFLAAFGLLTCAQTLIHGRSATADMPMILAVVAAQYALYELVHGTGERYPWRWFYLLYFALGLGFLAKGPVVFAVPLLTLAFHRWVFWRRPLPWRRLGVSLPAGLAIALLMMALWGLPALYKTHGLFGRVGLGAHVLERGWQTFDGHGGFFLYYLLTALFSLFPWIAFLGGGIAAVRRNWNEQNAYLLAWVAGTYLLFSFYVTKLPHYVMPAFPALFLMFGQLAQLREPAPRWGRVWFWALIGLVAVVAGTLATFAWTWRPAEPPFTGMRWMAMGGGLTVLGLAGLAVMVWMRRAQSALLAVVIVCLGFLWVGSGLRQVTPAVELQSLFARMPPETQYGFYEFREPSLVFYSNRRWESLGRLEDVERFLRQPGPRVVVALERETRLEDALRWAVHRDEPLGSRVYLDEHTLMDDSLGTRLNIRGLNIARTCAVTLRVYVRP